MDILYTPKFIKQYKKLPKEIMSMIEEKESIFRVDPYDARLKTHKLHGKFSGEFAFSVNYRYRVIFDFAKDNKTIRLLAVGTHDIYE